MAWLLTFGAIRFLSLIRRPRVTCVVGACVCAVLTQVGAAAQQRALRQTIIDGLRARLNGLDHLVVQYDWYECRASLSNDPFDRKNWIHDRFAHTLRYHAKIVRPHYRLHYSGPFKHQKSVDHAWVDGVRVAMTLDEDDGVWSIVRDTERWLTAGPIPTITPLELWQLFDIRESLLELLEAGKLSTSTDDSGVVVLYGQELYPPPAAWKLQAELDPARALLPTRISAELGVAGGEIKWQLRTVSSIPVNGAHAIGEAVIALTNTAVNKEKWQIYHYKVTAIRHEPNLARSDLLILMPENNYRIVDEIELYTREVAANGVVTHEERWTPEERAAQRRAVWQTAQSVLYSRELQANRRRVFFTTVGAGGALALLALCGVVWYRRKQAAARS